MSNRNVTNRLPGCKPLSSGISRGPPNVVVPEPVVRYHAPSRMELNDPKENLFALQEMRLFPVILVFYTVLNPLAEHELLTFTSREWPGPR